MKTNKLDFSLKAKRNQMLAIIICFASMIFLTLLGGVIGAATNYSKVWTKAAGALLIICMLICWGVFVLTLLTVIDSKAISKTIGFKQKRITVWTPIYWGLVFALFFGILAWKMTYLEKHWFYWMIICIYVGIWSGMTVLYSFLFKGLNKVVKK